MKPTVPSGAGAPGSRRGPRKYDLAVLTTEEFAGLVEAVRRGDAGPPEEDS